MGGREAPLHRLVIPDVTNALGNQTIIKQRFSLYDLNSGNQMHLITPPKPMRHQER